jgi:predicted transcriptional regulator of viral defense system
VIKKIQAIGARETAFLASIRLQGKTLFEFADAVSFWGSRHYAKIAIHRLVKKRWLIQLERGKYLIIPLEAGESRQWTEDSFLIADALVKPAAIAYWTAIKHWNWTEQIPRIIYVQTTARKKTPRRTILGVEYEFVTVPPRRFFGHVLEWRNTTQVQVTDREKTLLDCAHDVERAGGIEELIKGVRSGAPEISWRKLGEYSTRFANKAALKRLGFLFETLVPQRPQEAEQVLSSWNNSLSSGIASLQPSLKAKGSISTRWRLRINTEVR